MLLLNCALNVCSSKYPVDCFGRDPSNLRCLAETFNLCESLCASLSPNIEIRKPQPCAWPLHNTHTNKHTQPKFVEKVTCVRVCAYNHTSSAFISLLLLFLAKQLLASRLLVLRKWEPFDHPTCMYVSMSKYVCMHVCMHVCMNTNVCINVCVYADTKTCARVYLYVCFSISWLTISLASRFAPALSSSWTNGIFPPMQAYIKEFQPFCSHKHTYYICMYVCLYVCMYVCLLTCANYGGFVCMIWFWCVYVCIGVLTYIILGLYVCPCVKQQLHTFDISSSRRP